MNLVTVSGLRLRLADGTQLLDGVDFEIEPGGTLGVIGASGSGKSLTSRLLLGVRPAGAQVSGVVRVAGVDVLSASEPRLEGLRRREVAFVHQDPRAAIHPMRRLGRLFAETRPRAGRVQDRERLAGLLERLRLPAEAELRRKYPHELSGGMLQRVAIAAALLRSPQLLILDEATSALDVTTQSETMALVQRLQGEEGFGVLAITHDLHLAAAISDRLVVLERGRSVEQGPSAELSRNPRSEAAVRLMSFTGDGLRRASVAGGVGTPGIAETLVDAAPVVRAVGVTRVYRSGTRPALAGVNLTVGRGGSLGIVGESGSGKSTLARILVGLDEASEGEVLRAAPDAKGPRLRRLAAARSLQLVFQDPGTTLDPRVRIVDAVTRVLRLHGQDRGAEKAEAAVLLEQVGMPAELHERLPAQLSGGQRQRVAIARALAVRPDALVLDEATSALDVMVQAQILELVERLRREQGIAIVCISHDLSVVSRLCQRVMVMRRGTVVEEGETARVFEQPRHAYTRELIAAVPRPGWQPSDSAVLS